MFAQVFRFDPGQILQPAYESPYNQLVPAQFGASLTITKGQALAQKTSDLKMYPLNRGASDGTQLFGGFAQFPFATDSNGIIYAVFGGTAAGASYFNTGDTFAEFYRGGIFYPGQLFTSATGASVAEIDTITPTGTVTAGDVWTLGSSNAGGAEVTVVVNATATATSVSTQLKLAWNADPALAAIATATSAAFLTLTAVTPGELMNNFVSVQGTGTCTGGVVIATPAVAAAQTEVDTFTPGGTITTGDVNTITLTEPNQVTSTVSFTTGATTTATAVANGLRAAWVLNPIFANLATVSGTSTLIATGNNAATALGLTSAVTGIGTLVKTATTPATGRNFADVQANRPAAYIEQPSGLWVIP